ncbi:cytokinesis protein 3 [Cladobotryum mycophilum]|uniref:Cytokinesis protein 3 n=1 Tax=Cladobotryum mycophilum TaxID=491253 RepID=A0ABR0SMT5_9HYPO
MALAPPPLPSRFPCWCRAVYSWGGESKRDLGFMEGDLIECLNAGDGSWWVGRLYRDRRTVGSFPSNFVEVLPDDFRPIKAPSPQPAPSIKSNAPNKSKTFRKPFEAYAKAPHYTTAKQPETFREVPKQRLTEKPSREATTTSRPRENSATSMALVPLRNIHDDIGHVPPPPQMNGYGSRAASPNPSRAPSPAPRGVSPAPSMNRPPSRRGSMGRADSPPPPAPPPHRHVVRKGSNASEIAQDYHNGSRNNSIVSYNPHDVLRHDSNASYNQYSVPSHASNNSYNSQNALSRQGSYTTYDEMGYSVRDEGYHTPQGRTSQRPSLEGNQMTPSPLREAMDGVMQQLDRLEGIGGRDATPEPPLDPWSPESFDMVSTRPRARTYDRGRPLTAMGMSNYDEGYETWGGGSSQNTSYQNGHAGKPPSSAIITPNVDRTDEAPPPPPPKGHPYNRPKSAAGDAMAQDRDRKVRARKSAYEMGGAMERTYTTKTNYTNASMGNQSNSSSSTQSSARTLWSGVSAGGFSSTSAGSLARTHQRTQSTLSLIEGDQDRPESPFTGVTYHSSHASDIAASRLPRPASHADLQEDGTAGLGGLVHPRAPKRNIFKKIFESAKTGVASNRGSIAAGHMPTVRSSPFARSQHPGPPPMPGMGGSYVKRDMAREMGLNAGIDWVQVRRDVNRSNSLSKIERTERRDRCQMQEHPAINPVDELYEGIEGDEGADGMPVHRPENYHSINLSLVDKNSRFINEAPPGTTSEVLATTYVCRPYRSDVQRLRAIFTWVAEKVCWEEDFEGNIDTERVIHAKRACAEEYAVLVMEMCSAVGLHCEIVRGYLKAPGDMPDLNMMPRSNHWWNAVVVDNEWRIIDACLASPSNPKRGLYSSVTGSSADPWWFLTRPTEICWTHVPEHHDQQHIIPPVAHETLLNLPCTCPGYFRNEIEMVDYNTSLVRIEDLEMVHLKFNVPADVEIAAEVEARALSRDGDGDMFESGDIVRKKALAQAEWYNGVKRYTVKALLPGDEGQGSLKIYAGKRGLMQTIKDIPHPLAFSLPIIHTGENPPYEFVTIHPTPHAQRHDLYVVQPQCQQLALNNTFVFAIRQHPSSVTNGPQSALTPASNPGKTSPIPFGRPSSALSMNASSVSGSNPSSASGTVAGKKPAKLAIQTPGGKILRLMRKEERRGISVGSRTMGGDEEASDGGTWETIIKCSEKGVWRGLVLADRTARWCVFAEWVCVG